MISFILIAAASLLICAEIPQYRGIFLAFAMLGMPGGWLAIAPTATASYFGTCDIRGAMASCSLHTVQVALSDHS